MADAKKKSSATVRTRVVSDDATTTPKEKPAKKAAAATKTAKAADTTTKKPHRLKLARKRSTSEKKPRDNYFIGAWRELRQVRWPDRQATWSMTLSVIGFTIFFVALILLLDAGFKFMFDFIVKKG